MFLMAAFRFALKKLQKHNLFIATREPPLQRLFRNLLKHNPIQTGIGLFVDVLQTL
jgi:hypothetical protein